MFRLQDFCVNDQVEMEIPQTESIPITTDCSRAAVPAGDVDGLVERPPRQSNVNTPDDLARYSYYFPEDNSLVPDRESALSEVSRSDTKSDSTRFINDSNNAERIRLNQVMKT